jgi:hypothetical protein
MDSAAGIAEWWLSPMGVPVDVGVMRRVLDGLAERGLLERIGVGVRAPSFEKVLKLEQRRCSMAKVPATSNGPFEFTDGKGKFWSIPLTAINFVQGQCVVDPAWQPLTNAQPAKALLAYEVSAGIIAPAPTPSPFPAMVIQTADPGPGGNNISIEVRISNVITSPPTDDPTQTVFSLTVSETDKYPGLTAATIQSQLLPGGLLQVESVDPTGSPSPVSNKNLVFAGSPASSAQLDVDGTGSPPLVFTLVAKKGGVEGKYTQVTITPDMTSPPSSGPETFTLVATWSKTVSGITLETLESIVSGGLSYLISVSKPSSGAFSVPAGGLTTFLSGGGQGANASATLFTGQ